MSGSRESDCRGILIVDALVWPKYSADAPRQCRLMSAPRVNRLHSWRILMRNRITCGALVAALWSGLALTAGALEQNLLVNGGFEITEHVGPRMLARYTDNGKINPFDSPDPLLPVNWVWWVNQGCTRLRVSSEAHSGKHALEIACPKGVFYAAFGMGAIEVVPGADLLLWRLGERRRQGTHLHLGQCLRRAKRTGERGSCAEAGVDGIPRDDCHPRQHPHRDDPLASRTRREGPCGRPFLFGRPRGAFRCRRSPDRKVQEGRAYPSVC